MVAVNQLLCMSLNRGTGDSSITQIHTPCASSAALLTLAAAPAFYAGFETKQNVSVAEEAMRCYNCEIFLQGSTSVGQIFTEDTAK